VKSKVFCVQLERSATEIQHVYGDEARFFNGISVFMKERIKGKMIRGPAVHPPPAILTTLSKTGIIKKQKSPHYRPNVVRGAEHEQEGLPRNFI